MKITITGDADVNKRLSNMRRYVVKVVGAPATNLVAQSALEMSLKQAKTFYATPANGPSYPLRWKSKKQRIAVMIRLREEGNLPYRRTGRLASAWSYGVKADTITIANNARDSKTGKFIAPFVIGTFQQPFHKDTGWQKRSASIEKQIIKPITDDILKRAKDGLESSNNG